MSDWQEVNSCFICDRYHYTVIRFESILAYYDELEDKVPQKEKDSILNYCQDINPDFYLYEAGNLEENTAYI